MDGSVFFHHRQSQLVLPPLCSRSFQLILRFLLDIDYPAALTMDRLVQWAQSQVLRDFCSCRHFQLCSETLRALSQSQGAVLCKISPSESNGREFVASEANRTGGGPFMLHGTNGCSTGTDSMLYGSIRHRHRHGHLDSSALTAPCWNS